MGLFLMLRRSDVEGLSEIKGFNAFVRDFHPSYLADEVLMGLNTPIRIGAAIVLPGDLVIAKREGVLFVPAHLAEQVVSVAEFVSLKDDFGFEMVKTGRFKTGQIDSEWSPEVKQAFYKWVDEHPDKVKMSKATMEKILEKRKTAVVVNTGSSLKIENKPFRAVVEHP